MKNRCLPIQRKSEVIVMDQGMNNNGMNNNEMNNYGTSNMGQNENGALHPEPEKKGKWKTAKLLTGALIAGLLAGAAFEGGQYAVTQFMAKDAKEATIEEEDTAITATSTSATSSSDVSQVVENVMPSIVAVNTTVTEAVQFWGQTYEEESTGSGSGIIIGENDDELLVATNNHVIEGEEAEVTVTFSNDTTATATVKGADSGSDLAVLAINKSELTSETKDSIRIATLGDSDALKVGDMAIAIGNALGYGQSVTVGYISAKEREVAFDDGSMTLLQTDAAINPGNSGGALINTAGEVIGINSAKYASEEVEGMGYAIPISDAVPIINELMNREQLDISEQGYLGIRGDDITEEKSSFYNMPEGIYVGEVVEGSPAEKGGLVAGNIITAIDGREVTTLETLQDVLAYTKAGTTISITVQELKDGAYEEKTVEVTLGSKSENEEDSSSVENSQKENNQQQMPNGR